MDRETSERLLRLEIELRETRQEVKDLESKVSYYDRLALKWGGVCMGAVVIGALVTGHVDKVRERIIAWFL